MSTPSLSILTPVFNTADYLPECLDSILAQTLKDFELIIVDDGSTDKTPDILKRYAEKDPRIKIITKKNSGYGDSLNRALKIAKGEYVGIVEPDDWIDRNMYSDLLKIAKKHNADLVKSSFYYYYGEAKRDIPEKLFLHGEEKHLLDPKKEQKVFLAAPSIWSAIYRTETLKNHQVEFLPTPGASYQDIGFAFKSFASSEKVYCTNTPYCHYRQDNASSSVKSTKKVSAVKKEFDEIDAWLKVNNLSSTFAEVAAACRFRSYMWNLNRLKLKSALAFSKTVKKDYKKAKKTTNFTADYFLSLERGFETQFATTHPSTYVYLRPLFSLKNRTLRLASKAYHAIIKS